MTTTRERSVVQIVVANDGVELIGLLTHRFSRLPGGAASVAMMAGVEIQISPSLGSSLVGIQSR